MIIIIITANPLKRYHVSQTADQLPDIRVKQAMYRTDLEKQIEEQRERERRRRQLEAEDEERLEMKLQAERDKLRRDWMDETESRRLKVTRPSIQQKGSRFYPTTTEEETEGQVLYLNIKELHMQVIYRTDITIYYYKNNFPFILISPPR